MSRTSRHQLLLTDREYEWARRVVTRKADQAERMGEELNRRLRLEIGAFADKFAKPPELVQVGASLLLQLPTVRNELRMLEKIASDEQQLLTNVVLPEYERRRAPDYIAATASQIDLLGLLLTKIRKALSQ